MADTSFVVRNTLVVNTALTVNSTSLGYTSNTATFGTAAYFVANGNFGLSNSAPTTKLSVNGTSYFGGNITLPSTVGISANGGFGTAGQALVSNGSAVYWGTVVAGSNTQIQFNNSGQPAGSAGFTFNVTTNNVSVANAISVGGVANITGNLGVAGIINVTGGGGGASLNLYSGGDFVLYNAANTGSATWYCDNNGEIRTNGNTYMSGSALVVGDVISNYSDDRLKDRRANIDNALDKLTKLNGFYYAPNRTALQLGLEKNQMSKVGVSAQECQEVLPEVVKEAAIGQGYLTVQYEKLVPLLIEAIKELNAKVEKLGG